MIRVYMERQRNQFRCFHVTSILMKGMADGVGYPIEMEVVVMDSI